MACECLTIINGDLARRGLPDCYIDTKRCVQNALTSDLDEGIAVVNIRVMKNERASSKGGPYIPKFCPFCGVRYFPIPEVPPVAEMAASEVQAKVTSLFGDTTEGGGTEGGS